MEGDTTERTLWQREAEQDAVELDDDDEIRSEDDASDEDVHCDAEIDETNGEDGSGSDVDPDD
eukprot:CAMPEP_0197576598 /NCGR_PEP_ID=MMETSP1326-20131121/1570_1 /TAXON_ID=1155430 /ORGANISM="Genus nov. species nov., Strain RCC2288" /LENGTH=62 /DNA_ID=CAMNT_0043139553 /DNA_START=145 /DNA_END=333 /DNA_ORIENTATION=+